MQQVEISKLTSTIAVKVAPGRDDGLRPHECFKPSLKDVVRCVDSETGRLEYESRVPGANAFWASPWTDGLHLFALDSNGNTHVIAAGDELKVVALNELEQQAWGTPAVANGRIYLRTVENLYCIANDE